MHSITCRQPKLCVGYTREPWKVIEKADRTAALYTTGRSHLDQGKPLLLTLKSGLTLIN